MKIEIRFALRGDPQMWQGYQAVMKDNGWCDLHLGYQMQSRQHPLRLFVFRILRFEVVMTWPIKRSRVIGYGRRPREPRL